MKKQILVTTLLLGILLSGCSVDRNNSFSSNMGEDFQTSNIDETSEAGEPTEEELIELVGRAMDEISNLAFNDTSDVLNDIFNGELEVNYSNQVTIEGRPYGWTSRKYSELVDYYSQIFTGEPLDWLLSSRFTDVDGVLYSFVGGGATRPFSTIVSVEKVEGDTYRAYCQNSYGSEFDIIFSIEKTDAGYRISGIDYRPDTLGLD